MLLEPLAIAANVTQAAHTRLDHVLLTLANLFRIYSSTTVEPNVRDRITASLEKRWKAADQDVFIMAVFLNPYIRGHCFNRASLTSSAIISIAKRIFKRVFGVESEVDFVRGMVNYSTSMAEFTDEQLRLAETFSGH
ncbi:hypothetical protein B0H21DRAFT_751962 [Amylocystis lapponica]|nr:hypothetical protein B0H21DRAFT_751962 [Amylocystis lapponica]